ISYNSHEKYNGQPIILIIKIPARREITLIDIPGRLFLITEDKAAITYSFPIRARQRHPA
ncbi:hypothetical protein, partial [Escherichia coli]|uniref:hypothetical protein n=1 Tax=Escherichia coli TaxID=562 RepID=UPI001A90EFB2